MLDFFVSRLLEWKNFGKRRCIDGIRSSTKGAAGLLGSAIFGDFTMGTYVINKGAADGLSRPNLVQHLSHVNRDVKWTPSHCFPTISSRPRSY